MEIGDKKLVGPVKVNEINPDNASGNILLSGIIKTINNIQPDANGSLIIPSLVKSVNGATPDSSGNITINSIASTPYAISAGNTDTLDGRDSTSFANTATMYAKIIKHNTSSSTSLEFIKYTSGSNGTLYVNSYTNYADYSDYSNYSDYTAGNG